MRNALAVLAVVVCVALLSLTAEAAESYLGTVANADAGTGSGAPSNLTTATPFTIEPLALLTIQPNAAAYVCVNGTPVTLDAGILLADGGLDHPLQYRVPQCSSTLGVKVAADTAFPTSCGGNATWAMLDGGITSCVVSCVPVSGAQVSCPVWSRNGREF